MSMLKIVNDAAERRVVLHESVMRSAKRMASTSNSIGWCITAACLSAYAR
jgi:hypothetical protein